MRPHARNCNCEACEERLRQGIVKSVKGVPTEDDLYNWWPEYAT